MKKNLFLLGLVPFCLPLMGCGSSGTTGVGTKTPIDVIIMGGQSNMVGCSTYSGLADSVGSAKFNEYSRGYQGIKISYDCWTKNEDSTYSRQNTSSTKFIASLLGEGNSDLTFGPEVGMAETFSATRNDKVFLIKYACGSSNLLDDWAAPSSGKMTTMYAQFVEYVKAQIQLLISKGYDPTIKVMCWMQGEGDSYPGYAQEYYNQLFYFVKDLRAAFADYEDEAQFAFVDGGISDSATWSQYKTVNAAKKQFSELSDRNVYIDTIAAGLDKTKLQSDNAHYIGSAMVTLGHLFAAACEPFLTVL